MDWSDYEVEGQLSIFDLNTEVFKITKPIRLIEIFAGVGSQAMALRDLGADFEHYRVVEFDKYAIKSYNAIHGTDFPTMDVTEIKGIDLGIEDVKSFTYLLTYSFPCKDLSVAGLGKGMQKGSGTRSGLLWEVERLLNEVENLPKVLLMENVPQVHGKKNMDDFQRWIQFLESKGYSNYWQDLNAKNYGVAQNRNRCFMVSILGNYKYEFPKPIELTKRMKDYLEDEVDGVADLSFPESKTRRGRVQENGQVSPTLMAGEQDICRIETYSPYVNQKYKEFQEENGYIPEYFNPYNKTELTDVAPTLTAQGESVTKSSTVLKCDTHYRIRKLTPKECWRLMDFTDEDFEKAAQVNSNTQLYRQAGNSIIRNVLVAILGQLIEGKEDAYRKV